MQQQITPQSHAVIAPETGRKVTRFFFISLGVMLGGLLALGIGSLFLPEPLRDELFWNQLHSYNFPPLFFLQFSVILLPVIYIGPCVSIPVATGYKQCEWRIMG